MTCRFFIYNPFMRMLFRPGLSDFFFVAIFILVLAAGTQMLAIDSDLGRHLTMGNYILDHGVIPSRDLFSHTLPDQPRPPYEWLSQVIFTLAYRSLTLDGVIILTAILISIALALTYDFARRRSNSPLTAFVITFIAAAASSIHWLPRPHIISFLLLTIWIDKLERVRRGEKVSLFTLPLLMLLWANVHGGFIFGILAWIAYLAGWFMEKLRKTADSVVGKNLLSAGSLSVAVTIITPDLWHNWDAVLHNNSAYVLNRTAETMRPNFTDPSIWPFVFLIILTIIFSLITWRHVSYNHIFLLTGLGIISLFMARNIPLFAIACAPILSEWIAKASIRFQRWSAIEERFATHETRQHYPVVSFLAVALTIGYFFNSQSNYGKSILQFNPQIFPVQAADWIEAHPPHGRMFNDFNWGGYLLHRLWPNQQVFLDSQSDFYGESLIRDYDQIMTANGKWKDLLDHYQISWAIIPINSPLAKALSLGGNWKTVYKDKTSIILLRR